MKTIFTLAALCALAFAAREYHPIAITDLNSEDPANWKHPLSHIEVSGFVTYKLHEGDGDWHLRICDAANVKGMDHKHCIVAEIIPGSNLDIPTVGQQITVRGIGRYDAENPGHHWWEVHPVAEWEPSGANRKKP